MRRVYGQSWPITTLKGIILALAYFVMGNLLATETLELAIVMIARSH
jgi:hypothetical protein